PAARTDCIISFTVNRSVRPAKAHPEGGDVFAVFAVIYQLLRGLGERATAPGRQKERSKYLLHRFLPIRSQKLGHAFRTNLMHIRRNRGTLRTTVPAPRAAKRLGTTDVAILAPKTRLD